MVAQPSPLPRSVGALSPGRMLAACLVAGALDLLVIDLRLGPAVLAMEPGVPSPAAPLAPAAKPVAPLQTTAGKEATAPRAVVAADPVIADDAVVYFGTDSADLDDAARTQIGGLVVQFAAFDVVVEGHADPRGTDPHNRALSQRRAAAVADELASRGANLRGTTAFGATRPAARGRAPEALRLDRRVEIHFVRRGT